MWEEQEEDRPSTWPYDPWDSEGDIADFENALRKDLKESEDTLFRLLSRRSWHQREETVKKYKEKHGKDLEKELKDVMGEEYHEIIEVLYTPINEYLAQQLHLAMECKKPKTRVLVEILCSRNKFAIMKIMHEYEKLYGKTLQDAVREVLPADLFRDILIGMASMERSGDCEDYITFTWARKLYNEGNGISETEMVHVFTRLSHTHVRNVLQSYQKMAGETLGETFDSKYSGDLLENMKAVYTVFECRFQFFAEEMYRALVTEPNKADLIRLTYSRGDIDMNNIRTVYNKNYGRLMENDILDETAEPYRKIIHKFVRPYPP